MALPNFNLSSLTNEELIIELLSISDEEFLSDDPRMTASRTELLRRLNGGEYDRR